MRAIYTLMREHSDARFSMRDASLRERIREHILGAFGCSLGDRECGSTTAADRGTIANQMVVTSCVWPCIQLNVCMCVLE